MSDSPAPPVMSPAPPANEEGSGERAPVFLRNEGCGERAPAAFEMAPIPEALGISGSEMSRAPSPSACAFGVRNLGFGGYRGTSLIRKHPPPRTTRAFDIGLVEAVSYERATPVGFRNGSKGLRDQRDRDVPRAFSLCV